MNELDGTINVYERDLETGALREKQSITALAGPAAGDVRVDAENGILTMTGHVPSEPTPRGFAIDPQGKFLLCAGLTSGSVATYAIDQTSGRTRPGKRRGSWRGPNWIEIVPEESSSVSNGISSGDY